MTETISAAAIALVAGLAFWLFAWPSLRADLKRREQMTEAELKDDGWPHR